MSEPTFSGKRSNISVNFRRIVKIAGLKVVVVLEPGCWVTGSRLGLLAAHRIAGSARVLSRRLFERATLADIDAMLPRLRVVKCRVPGCRNPKLVGDGKQRGDEKGTCERHRLQAVVAAAAKVQERIDRERARADAAKLRQGFRYKATVWIHRDAGDDSAAVLYFVERPTISRVRREAVRRRSRLPDDFKIEKMKPVARGKRNRK
jgi:hypothetical protein